MYVSGQVTIPSTFCRDIGRKYIIIIIIIIITTTTIIIIIIIIHIFFFTFLYFPVIHKLKQTEVQF